ncbi:hypothetical protein LUZ60_000623 [Juncus effusus]|nr:hypothetical protein LUZ60_000623 [Juncus effusus]
MDSKEIMECDDMLQAQAELYSLIFSFYKPMALKCAVELGIPDAIHNHGQPMSLTNLQAALSLPPSKQPHLHRLMRMLTHMGFFGEKSTRDGDEVAYDLTSISKLVTSNMGPINLSTFVNIELHESLVKPSLYLSDWFKQESSVAPFEMVHGSNLWKMMSESPELTKLVHDGVSGDGHFLVDIIAKKCSYIFDGVGSLIDVGGGTGAMATAISDKFPNIKCAVLDLPHVVENLPKDGPVKFIPGDFFSYVPRAHVLVLKWILHGWSDEECVKILRRCKEAIPAKEYGGKIIIFEKILGSTDDNAIKEPQLLFDMLVMTALAGKQRHENEFQKLFEEAGFNSYKVIPELGKYRSIIEVYP